MKRILLTITLFALVLSASSHPWKPGHYVIIDTDGGIDDIRAISMLLASPDVRVLAITISPGALSYGSAYRKVKSLLNSYYHNGLPVGINRNSGFKSPSFQLAEKSIWGTEDNIDEKMAPDSKTVISHVLSAEKTKISFICLGGMSTAAEALNEIPEFSLQVKEIIWSSVIPGKKDLFNYTIDKIASEKVTNGKIPVKMIGGMNEDLFFDEQTLKSIASLQNIYAGSLTDFFKKEISSDHKYSFSANDELAVVWLHKPELFLPLAEKNVTGYSLTDLNSARETSVKILSGEYVAKNQVIKELPHNPAFYFDDIEPSVNEIIKRHGTDEWTSGVIANELHRHLGVFAIIGVKMGIRVREYFATGVDEFEVTSNAGSVPPLSCMNDGIQVSTGATAGHGLLTVNNTPPAKASAVFTYMDRKITITLKPEYTEKISSELKEINFIHGLDSDIYWELVRKNSIKYWRDLDRHEIFIIEESN